MKILASRVKLKLSEDLWVEIVRITDTDIIVESANKSLYRILASDIVGMEITDGLKTLILRRER